MAQTAREPVETVKATALENDARALAQEHPDLEGPRARRWRSADSSFDLPLFGAALAQAERHLSSSNLEDAAVLKAAEWFLDNHYLVRRVARQVAEELPRGFVRRLPRLASGRAKGFRRIDVLAREVIARSGIEPDREALLQFIHAYQEVSPLTIAELWALPTMLRAAVLRGLLTFLSKLIGPSRGSALVSHQDVETMATLPPNLGVERSIRALRVLADLDWMMFFEETNHVEARLREDPANVYARMDFQTCDAYRRAVEELAWTSQVSEVEVANRAVLLAKQAAPDPRRGHVGYYLVGSGRSALEEQINYRAAGLERIRRALMRHPMLTYVVPLLLGTAVMLGILWALLLGPDEGAFLKALVAGVTIAPLWSVALATLQSLLARLLPPRVLPKLNFTSGIPEDARTLVVIPTLLGRFEDIEGMLRQIERHYLANPDQRLGFALLTDDVDSLDAPTDNGLFERAAEGISRLNEKHGNARHEPFHLLHRKPHWNPAEGRYMGWERKRGKLEELNHLLRGDRDTSFLRRVGDPGKLQDIRFVITLDSDTELPMESAHRLVGLLAHPLNRAVFDEETGRVISGYSIVQPRVETSPSGAPPTKFGRILAGDVGFDIYAHASSELYQDLFGSGIYCGKGIYDVDAFMRSLDGRVPENRLASHDLFEGVHGRAALASDIVLFEQHPQHYATYARRMHRWVRGDWQLLPWLFPRVPSATGARIANPLAPIDRWKIADNLRRSLVAPCLCILLVAGWTFLPASPDPSRSRLTRNREALATMGGRRPERPARRVLDARSDGCPRRDRARARAHVHHAQALAAVDVRGAHGARSGRSLVASAALARHVARAASLTHRRRNRLLGAAASARRCGSFVGRLDDRPGDRAMAERRQPFGRGVAWRSGSKAASLVGVADMALLRDIRRARRPVVADRQLPGGASRADSAPNFADEHRHDASLYPVSLRLRLHRTGRARAPTAPCIRQHRAHGPLSGSSPQLVRHEEPPAAPPAVRLDRRQRQLRRMSPRAEARMRGRGRGSRAERQTLGRPRRHAGPRSRDRFEARLARRAGRARLF